MQKLVKGVALVMTIFCLTWVGALWVWQSQGHAVTSTDLLVYLALLPLVILLFVFGFRWAWTGAMATAAAPSAGAEQGGEPVPDAKSLGSDAQERALTSVALAYAIHTAAGTQASDLLEAVLSGKPLPSPDTLLCDGAGFPVLSARCQAVVDGEWPKELMALTVDVSRQQAAWDGLEPSVAAWRGLSLLAQPLGQVREELLSLLCQHAEAEAATANVTLAAPPSATVRLILAASPEATELERACLRAWSTHLLTLDWPPDAPTVNWRVDVFSGSGPALWLKVDQVLLTQHRERRDELLLVAATESLLDEDGVTRLGTQGRLYHSAHQPTGLMPGEAAVALLLGSVKWQLPAAQERLRPLIHRPAWQRRDKSIDVPGRGTALALSQVMQDALSAAAVTATDIGAMVCDADQHTQRATELFAGTLGQLPDLDPLEDFRLLGRLTGSVGVGSFLLPLAAGLEMVAQTGKPSLILGLADSFERVGLVVKAAS